LIMTPWPKSTLIFMLSPSYQY